ncbi:hypothetical protein HDV00_002556 [Rhizophlyctis rosea]|nr:hypothetical protein HDV00_002556 [Rhizophlyctis rosea]
MISFRKATSRSASPLSAAADSRSAASAATTDGKKPAGWGVFEWVQSMESRLAALEEENQTLKRRVQDTEEDMEDVQKENKALRKRVEALEVGSGTANGMMNGEANASDGGSGMEEAMDEAMEEMVGGSKGKGHR